MRFLLVLLVAAALGCGGLVSPSGARAELESRGIAYNDAAFLNAARAGDLEVVRLFVEAGMSVNTASTSGVTALHGVFGVGGWLRDAYGDTKIARRTLPVPAVSIPSAAPRMV